MKKAVLIAAALFIGATGSASAGKRSIDTAAPTQIVGLSDVALCVLETHRDNIGEAFYWCDRSIRRGEATIDEQAVAYMHRGVLLLKTHDLDAAMRDIDKSISLTPHYGDAHFNRGNALFAMGKYQEAVESYQKALDQNNVTTPELAYYNRGKALERLGQTESARADLARAKELMPKDSPLAQRLSRR